jgi:hypothetical protein
MTPASPTGWVTPLGSVSGGQRLAQLPVQTDRPEWASGAKTYSVRPSPFTSTEPSDGTDPTAMAYEGGGPAAVGDVVDGGGVAVVDVGGVAVVDVDVDVVEVDVVEVVGADVVDAGVVDVGDVVDVVDVNVVEVDGDEPAAVAS